MANETTNQTTETAGCTDHLSTTSNRDTVLHGGNIYWDWHNPLSSALTTGTLPTPGMNKVMTFQPVDMDVLHADQTGTHPITGLPLAGAYGNIPYKIGNPAVGDVLVFTHRDDDVDYMRDFKQMYGSDAEQINILSIPQVAKTMNNLFLRKK